MFYSTPPPSLTIFSPLEAEFFRKTEDILHPDLDETRISVNAAEK